MILYGVDKQTGLKELLRILNISKEECIARLVTTITTCRLLINYVGIGVCMGNGSELLKKNSDYITSSADQNGIMNGLIHFGLI